MSNQQAPERVTITIPDEVRDIFSWIKKYESQFDGRDASIGAFLLKLGAEVYYLKGLEKIEPLSDEITNALNNSSIDGIFESIAEEPQHFAKAR